ncbi:MAG: RNA polymerase sigma factor [Bacteroides sp.]|nr:RNA polymerase sigma factor [Roseburia sp.]MCM1346471.1 RNA polymerase sigma factor [Bacteroides sp.]MCM1420340.1 RNA polymerase sigma factor [Bacteroides sp.]
MKEISFRYDVLPLKDKLFRLALRITLNREEAEDIVQDTLLRIWDKRAEWTELNSMEAFGMTVCRNLSLDRAERKERQNISLDEGTYDCMDFSSAPDVRMMHSESESIVGQLINRLPEKQRTVVHLRDIEGKTYKEIAGTLGLTEADVKVSLHRARTWIKEQFNRLDKYGL